MPITQGNAVTVEDMMTDVTDGAGGVTLADLRRASGKNQRELAEAMGVQRARVSQIEADFPNVHYLVVQRYLEAVGARLTVQVDELMFDSRELVTDEERKLTKNRRYPQGRAQIRRASGDIS